jgi:uncharacterized protein (TIGR03067 family)
MFKTSLALPAAIILVAASLGGCASANERDLSTMQGTWVGHEVQGPKGECRMVISGDSLKFQGAREQEHYTGKLSLNATNDPKRADVLIVDCAIPQYLKKSTNAIYKIEGNTFTIAACEPGTPGMPVSFTPDPAVQSRVFVFNKQP